MHLQCVVSDGPIIFFPTKVTVKIINRLINRYLTVQCKDKNTDIGVHQITVGQTYRLTFFLNLLFRPLYTFVILYSWKEIIILTYM